MSPDPVSFSCLSLFFFPYPVRTIDSRFLSGPSGITRTVFSGFGSGMFWWGFCHQAVSSSQEDERKNAVWGAYFRSTSPLGPPLSGPAHLCRRFPAHPLGSWSCLIFLAVGLTAGFRPGGEGGAACKKIQSNHPAALDYLCVSAGTPPAATMSADTMPAETVSAGTTPALQL